MLKFVNCLYQILLVGVVFLSTGCEFSKDELQIFFASKISLNTTTTFPESVSLDQSAPYTENSLPQFSLGTNAASQQVATSSGAAVQMGKSWVYRSEYGAPIVGFTDTSILKTIADPAKNLIIVATHYNVEMIDTKGTQDPADDVIINKFDSWSSAISLCSSGNYDSIYDMTWDSNNGLVYISTVGCGFTVIDTKGNTDPSDDVLLTRYTAFNPTGWAYSVMYEPVNHLVYLGTSHAGLIVIDTHGTKDPTDDTLVMTYTSATAPAIPDGWVLHTDIDLDTGLLYVSTNGGLAVINTQGTVSSADDTLVHLYTESTSPGVSSNWTPFSFLDHTNHILYIGGSSLIAIDTKGTIDPADDVELTRYNGSSTPAMAGGWIPSAFIDETSHYLYVSTNSGAYILDTKGTKTTADDVLISNYSLTSSPALSLNDTHHIELDKTNNLLYIGTWGDGLNVINLNGYNQKAFFESQHLSLTTLPKLFFSWINDIVSGSTATMQTRVATSTVWRNDFDDNATTEYLGDFYGWGSSWGSVVESGGTMKLSNPSPNTYGSAHWVDFIIDATAIPLNSTVTVRLRINSAARIRPSGWSDSVFSDDFWDYSVAAFTDNTWQTLSFDTFRHTASRIGFDVVWDGASWDQINDSIEIDWIRVETKSWSPWSTACSTSTHCQLDQASLVGKDFLQYRVNLTNTNPAVTPSVSSISFSAGYTSTKNFNSSVIHFNARTSLNTINANISAPSGTTVLFEYSLDGTTWNLVSLPFTFPEQTLATQIQWRTTLSTTDPAITPTISNVRIESTP